MLEPLVGAGDFVLNLAVDVSSTALIAFCQARGALYLDTCIEPWFGDYFDASVPPAARTNYAQREAALALRRPARNGPTALVNHGANPGLVSHLLKQALLDLARETGVATDVPQARADWARLAQRLGVRVIHVAERDTQVGDPAQGTRRVRQHLVGARAASTRAASRPSSAGAATSARCPPTARGTPPARARRST